MPDDRPIVIVIDPRRVREFLRDALTVLVGTVALFAWLFFGAAWAAV